MDSDLSPGSASARIKRLFRENCKMRAETNQSGQTRARGAAEYVAAFSRNWRRSRPYLPLVWNVHVEWKLRGEIGAELIEHVTKAQGLPQPASTPMSGCSRHAAQQRRAVSKWRFSDACGRPHDWLRIPVISALPKPKSRKSATETEPSAVYLALIFNPDEPNAFFCLQSVETPATDLIIRTY
jgi:hypothetical protein